jgi:hypothetical protein
MYNKKFYLPGHDTVYSTESEPMFQRNMSPPSSGFKIKSCFMPIFCLANSSTQKMEAAFSSEMSADFQWTAQHNIQEDKNLNKHHHQKLKPYKIYNTLCLYNFFRLLT